MGILNLFKSRIVIASVVGVIIGVVIALLAEKGDHLTTTDEFCTSCHAMQSYIADTEVYKNSAHQTTLSGVRAGCADCHIPKGLLASSYTHVVNGMSDILGQIRHDYEQPETWQKEKSRLAYAVRDWFYANDSITCRGCHEETSIKPSRKRGQRQHIQAQEEKLTCIACHYNLVHEGVEPRDSFLELSGNSK